MECCNHNRFLPQDLKRIAIIHTDQFNILLVWIFVIRHYIVSPLPNTLLLRGLSGNTVILAHHHNSISFLRLVAVMFRSHCFSLTLTCLQNTYISLFVGSLESSEWSSPDNANITGAAIIIITRRVPVEQEIINVYDVFEIYDHTILRFTHIFLLRGTAPYPAGALTTPLRPPAGLLATFGGFDIPTFKISLSFLITAWQLCIYRVAI